MPTTYELGSIGTRIANNDDLDDYTTPGIYSTMTASVSASLSNCPTSTSAFKLIVEVTSADVRRQQTIITNAADCATYIRRYTPSGWSSWYQITGTVV